MNLANGTRLDKLHFKNVQLGKVGLSDSFTINRTSGVTGAMVNVGQLTITNSSTPTLAWSNMTVNSLALGAYVDGHTQAVVLDNTVPLLVIDSDRGSGSYLVENSVVDKIIISTNGDLGAYIGELIIEGVTASSGAWTWDYLAVGILTMDGSNKIGNGTGIDVPSAVFNSSISARSVVDNLVDTPIKVQ